MGSASNAVRNVATDPEYGTNPNYCTVISLSLRLPTNSFF